MKRWRRLAGTERVGQASGGYELPQEGRSDAHRTYRCYLRGPDGVRELASYGSWGNNRKRSRTSHPGQALPVVTFTRKSMQDHAWKANLITEDDDLRRILQQSKHVAILGIKPETRSAKPAFYVPRYLQRVGYDIVPVPVYYPEVTRILGEPVFRTVSAIAGKIDLVVVFRRAEDIPPHVADLIAKKPVAVWFQLGIRNDEAAERLARAGIAVVQDRCSMVEHRRLVRK